MLFDLSITKLLVLAVLALVIFGPDQLPKIASQAGRMLGELRRMADGATHDLRESLGPEFRDFDVADLNPRHFVRKHLLEGLENFAEPDEVPVAGAGVTSGPDRPGGLQPGERPPYDPEAT